MCQNLTHEGPNSAAALYSLTQQVDVDVELRRNSTTRGVGAKPSSTHGTLVMIVSMNRRLNSIADRLWNGGKLAARRRAAATGPERVVIAF